MKFAPLHYSMSMIRKNGNKDYFGIFETYKEAQDKANEYIELDLIYAGYEINRF